MNTSPNLLYENDFYGWIQHQAHTLRTRNLSALDFEHLIEEIESMGRSEQRALESRLEILLMHLLKWQFQPRLQGPSWRFTIKEQRRRIAKLLKKNPSLTSMLNEVINDAYESARILAAEETGLDESTFPNICPWSFEQIMDETFWPQTNDNPIMDSLL